MTLQAIIREADCIGCAKCLDVCPTDAIIGAPKFLHQVLADDCIGCERCVPVCPVDCIDLIPMPDAVDPEKITHEKRLERKAHFGFLAKRRKERLLKQKQQAKQRFANMRDQMKDLL